MHSSFGRNQTNRAQQIKCTMQNSRQIRPTVICRSMHEEEKIQATTHPFMKLPLLYMVTGTSRVSIAVRAEVIWIRTVYLVEMMGLSMVVQRVGMVMK